MVLAAKIWTARKKRRRRRGGSGCFSSIILAHANLDLLALPPGTPTISMLRAPPPPFAHTLARRRPAPTLQPRSGCQRLTGSGPGAGARCEAYREESGFWTAREKLGRLACVCAWDHLAFQRAAKHPLPAVWSRTPMISTIRAPCAPHCGKKGPERGGVRPGSEHR